MDVYMRHADVAEGALRRSGNPFDEWWDWSFRSRMAGKNSVYQGPVISDEMLLDMQIRRATRGNAERWSQAAHAGEQMELYLFVDDCPHSNPEDDPRYDVAEWFDHRVWRARYGRSNPDPYILAFMKAAADQCPIVQEFRTAYAEWDENHNIVCKLSPQGSVCVVCAKANDEYNEDGMEPSGCSLGMDVREAYDEFWYANGERA